MRRLDEQVRAIIDGDVEPVTAAEARERAVQPRRDSTPPRRRPLLVGAIAAILVVGLVGGIALVDDGGGGGAERAVVSPKVVRNVQARASLVLPTNWQELPTVPTTEPTEVLVVGTAPRPDDDPIGGCDPSTVLPDGSAYVSVYEYETGARLNSPDHAAVYDATQFVSRPASFVDTISVGPYTCPVEIDAGGVDTETGSGPPPESVVLSTGDGGLPDDGHVADFTFIDGGRFFVARVVATDDPDGTRFAEAIAVLDSLQIAVPPEVTTTTGPEAVTPSTAVAAEETDVARQAILDALRGTFGGGGPLTGDDAIIGGFPLGPRSRDAAREEKKEFIGVIVPRINWLTLDTPTHATFSFDLLIDAQIVTATTTGEGIFVDGMWKITSETFCTIARRGNVTCPAAA